MSWPRLSETLSGDTPACCQNCGSTEQIWRWREHDDNDKPEQIAVMLCKKCSDKIIEPHPRLYSTLRPHEPMPGTMPICIDCFYRAKMRCTHHSLRENGGKGLPLRFPQPSVAFVDGTRNGRRTGWRELVYFEDATCASRTPRTSAEPTTP